MAALLERGLLYVVIQFTLFGLVPYINWASLLFAEGNWDFIALCFGHAPLEARITGGVFAIFGLAVTLKSFPDAGAPNMFPLPTEGSALKTNGVYAYVRHPGNLGNTILFTGGSISFGTPVGALSAWILLSAFFWIKNGLEERYMTEMHGAKWAAYKAQVPVRFCPPLVGVLVFGVLCLTIFLNDIHPYNKAIVTLTVATCGLALLQMLYYYENHYLKSQTSSLLWCLGTSGAVALANCCAATLESRYSYEFYTQLSSLFRVLWVYHYLLLLLSYFQPFGGGGKEELLQATGEIMKAASLPPGSYAPPFRLCTCASTYIPGPDFLRGSFRRVEYYIAGTLLLACGKLTLHLEGGTRVLGCAIEYSGATGTILKVLDIAVVFLGLSGVLALASTIDPLLTPSRRDVVTLRHRMFLYMQTFVALQTVLIFGIIVPQVTDLCTTQHIEGLTIAVEMLLIQILSHKAFVPKFGWGPWIRILTPLEQDSVPAEFNFLLPLEEMALALQSEKNGDGDGAEKVAIELTSNGCARNSVTPIQPWTAQPPQAVPAHC